MISTIETTISTPTSGRCLHSNGRMSVVVKELLDRLSEHFSQPIHISTIDNDDRHLESSPFVQEVLRQLIEQSVDIGADGDETGSTVALYALVQYYRSNIRHQLWRQQHAHFVTDKRSVPVLVHWYSLLRMYLRYLDDSGIPKTCCFDEEMQATLLAIVGDITVVATIEGDCHSNTVFPLLLRLMDTLLRLVCSPLTPAVGRSIYCAIATTSVTTPWLYESLVPVDRILNVAKHYSVPTLELPKDIGWEPFTLWRQVGLNEDTVPVEAKDPTHWAQRILRSLARIYGTDPEDIDDDTDTAQLEHRLIEHLGVVACAEQVRRHFFGQDSNNNSMQPQPPVQRRLHLGRTITEASKSTKEARDDCHPSKLRVVVGFCCLLQPKDDIPTVLSTLAPVLYTFLDHSAADLVRWGASLLIRLLGLQVGSTPKRTNRASTMQENLLTVLQSTIGTQRYGKTLLLLGTAQNLLLQSMDDPSDPSTQQQMYERRLKVTHQWLHLLSHNNQHHTTNHMLWGLVIGGALPSLHALCSNTIIDFKVLSLVRPGLQALLPLLLDSDDVVDLGCFRAIPDDDDVDETENHTKLGTQSLIRHSVHVAALLGLLHVLRFGYHVTQQRHTGKILCTLIAFARRKRDQQLYHLSITTAAVAVKSGDSNATAILDRLVAVGDSNCDEANGNTPIYDDKIHDIVAAIRHEAEGMVRGSSTAVSARHEVRA